MERDLRAFREGGPRNICGIAAAVVSAVATVGAGAMNAHAAGNAANKQVQAANNATQTQKDMYDLTRGDLQPYNLAGQSALNMLMGRVGDLSNGVPLPPKMTQSQLEQTPGYQFNLSQGLKSVQNSAAARGLGVSGAALKGASAYATGLADSTYQQQFANQQQLFNDAVTNQTNTYNRLMGITGIGENAAAKVGNIGAQTANSISNAQIGAGNAMAGGIVGQANALSGAISNLGQLGMAYGMYQGGFGGGGGINTSGYNVTNYPAPDLEGLY